MFILFSFMLMTLFSNTQTQEEISRSERNFYANNNEPQNVYSPRMDYDEWTPLGRGDPLKNDPTYDYVPPVLERVHYWMDPSKRTPDPPLSNSGVLVLGSSRTETPHTTLTTKEAVADSRLDTMSLLDPFFKLMDVSKFGLNLNQNTVHKYHPTTARPTFHYYQSFNTPRTPPPQALQRPPYTILMPPPLPTDEKTTERIPVETKTQYATVAPTASSSITTENQTVFTTALSYNENVYKPVAINMPEINTNETQNYIPVTEYTTGYNLPIISLFTNHKKEIEPSDNDKNELDNNIKEPSEVMIPPPEIMEVPGEYYIKHYKEEEVYTTTTTTTMKPIKTTPLVRTLTTDPIFRHYKQPKEPMNGPFYLIIQGHSKVKTYGASKNKIDGSSKAVSTNEISDTDERVKRLLNRQERKLKGDFMSDENAEIVEGKPMVEVAASYKTDDINFSVMDALEDTFSKTKGGQSKKRNLTPNSQKRRKRFVGRKLLSTLERKEQPTTKSISPTKSTTSSTEEEDDLRQQIGLESLIALSEDENVEINVINTLLKEEGQGSGIGGLVSSIFSRDIKLNEEI